MRLLYDNKIAGAILTPSSENANYPASNLKDPRLSRHLRFTGDEDENLLVDAGGVLKASYAALAGHNLSSGASIKVQGNDYDSWNDPPFEQELVWDADIILKNFTEKEYSYWRFVFVDPNNEDDYIKLGLPYLGTYLQFPPIEPTAKISYIDLSIKQISGSGQIYGRKRYKKYVPAFNFPIIEQTERQSIDEMFDSIGNITPIILLVWENDLAVFRPLYCTIVESQLDWQKSDYGLYWSVPLSFEEVF